MKKILKIASVILITVTLVCMLTSCSKALKGTYVPADSDGSIIKGSLTFDKDNYVSGTLSVAGIDYTIDGEYVIEDEKITFTYKHMIFSKEISFPFEKDGKSIFIDSVEFVREK